MTDYIIQGAPTVALSKIPSSHNHLSMSYCWGPRRAFPTLGLSGNWGKHSLLKVRKSIKLSSQLA